MRDAPEVETETEVGMVALDLALPCGAWPPAPALRDVRGAMPEAHAPKIAIEITESASSLRETTAAVMM